LMLVDEVVSGMVIPRRSQLDDGGGVVLRMLRNPW